MTVLPWLETVSVAVLLRVETTSVSGRLRRFPERELSNFSGFVALVTAALRVFTGVLAGAGFLAGFAADFEADFFDAGAGAGVAVSALPISACACLNAASMAPASSSACGSACLSPTMPKSTWPA